MVDSIAAIIVVALAGLFLYVAYLMLKEVIKKIVYIIKWYPRTPVERELDKKRRRRNKLNPIASESYSYSPDPGITNTKCDSGNDGGDCD